MKGSQFNTPTTLEEAKKAVFLMNTTLGIITGEAQHLLDSLLKIIEQQEIIERKFGIHCTPTATPGTTTPK